MQTSIRRRHENQGLSMSLSMAPQSDIQTPRTMSVTMGQVPIPNQLMKRNYVRQSSANTHHLTTPTVKSTGDTQSMNSAYQSVLPLEEKEENQLQIVENENEDEDKHRKGNKNKNKNKSKHRKKTKEYDDNMDNPMIISSKSAQDNNNKEDDISSDVAKLDDRAKSDPIGDNDKKKKRNKSQHHHQRETREASKSAYIQRPSSQSVASLRGQHQNSVFNLGGFVSRSVLEDSKSTRAILRQSRSNQQQQSVHKKKIDKDKDKENDDESLSFSDI